MRTTNLNWFLYAIGYYKRKWEHEEEIGGENEK